MHLGIVVESDWNGETVRAYPMMDGGADLLLVWRSKQSSCAMADLEQGTTIKGDRADVIYRKQALVKETIAKIIAGNYHPERFDDVNWASRAAEEVYGYIDRVIRHQEWHGGRPGNSGRK